MAPVVDTSATSPSGHHRGVVFTRFRDERENRQLGGRHYPISAVRLSCDDWKRHFGPHSERLVQARRRFDPDDVLTPGPGIFGP